MTRDASSYALWLSVEEFGPDGVAVEGDVDLSLGRTYRDTDLRRMEAVTRLLDMLADGIVDLAATVEEWQEVRASMRNVDGDPVDYEAYDTARFDYGEAVLEALEAAWDRPVTSPCASGAVHSTFAGHMVCNATGGCDALGTVHSPEVCDAAAMRHRHLHEPLALEQDAILMAYRFPGHAFASEQSGDMFVHERHDGCDCLRQAKRAWAHTEVR